MPTVIINSSNVRTVLRGKEVNSVMPISCTESEGVVATCSVYGYCPCGSGVVAATWGFCRRYPGSRVALAVWSNALNLTLAP